MQTNLLGKWAQHDIHKHRRGIIVGVCNNAADMWIFVREDDGRIDRVCYRDALVYDQRPDTNGPYR